MDAIKALTLANAIMGVILAAGGNITAYATSVGSAAHTPGLVTVVALVIGGVGVAQTIAAGVLQTWHSLGQAKIAAIRGN